jgi:hypothetical protein
MQLSVEVGVFAALARRLYGENWKGPTAFALGVRRDTLNKIMRGKLPLQPGLLLKLQLHYEETIHEHDDRARRTESLREGHDGAHGPPDGGRE